MRSGPPSLLTVTVSGAAAKAVCASPPPTEPLPGRDSHPGRAQRQVGLAHAQRRVICARSRASLTLMSAALIRQASSMRLHEKGAQQLPLRRKHAGWIMEVYA